MKLLITIFISLILLSPGIASYPSSGFGIAVAFVGFESLILIGGTSIAINNYNYLTSLDGNLTSITAGYILGTLNLATGLLISLYLAPAPDLNEEIEIPISILGIGQLILGVIDVGTTIVIHSKSKQRQLTLAPTIISTSNKKPVMGLNFSLTI